METVWILIGARVVLKEGLYNLLTKALTGRGKSRFRVIKNLLWWQVAIAITIFALFGDRSTVGLSIPLVIVFGLGVLDVAATAMRWDWVNTAVVPNAGLGRAADVLILVSGGIFLEQWADFTVVRLTGISLCLLAGAIFVWRMHEEQVVRGRALRRYVLFSLGTATVAATMWFMMGVARTSDALTPESYLLYSHLGIAVGAFFAWRVPKVCPNQRETPTREQHWLTLVAAFTNVLAVYLLARVYANGAPTTVAAVMMIARIVGPAATAVLFKKERNILQKVGLFWGLVFALLATAGVTLLVYAKT